MHALIDMAPYNRRRVDNASLVAQSLLPPRLLLIQRCECEPCSDAWVQGDYKYGGSCSVAFPGA